jgi:hypothetical protein
MRGSVGILVQGLRLVQRGPAEPISVAQWPRQPMVRIIAKIFVGSIVFKPHASFLSRIVPIVVVQLPKVRLKFRT